MELAYLNNIKKSYLSAIHILFSLCVILLWLQLKLMLEVTVNSALVPNLGVSTFNRKKINFHSQPVIYIIWNCRPRRQEFNDAWQSTDPITHSWDIWF